MWQGAGINRTLTLTYASSKRAKSGRVQKIMARTIPAVRFKQWLPEWDAFDFDPAHQRRKPGEYIYLFSMPAIQLRSLSGVFRRQRDGSGAEGLQRLHDPKRSATIRDFVKYGYPYSSLSLPLRNHTNEALKKPGWLPTAIVVNILTDEDERRGRRVATSDIVAVKDHSNAAAELTLPYDNSTEKWSPQELEPFEVIDGQHRLWAFDEAMKDGSLPGDFELPVVAFRGLDVGWQAYLFWSINVSPKKINPSHAFDLFPLLRTEAWLDTFSELKIYREARAQELTELMYEHPDSPWHHRVNMLGEAAKTAPQFAGVTQAGWVRALASTYLASGGSGRGSRGLFTSETSPVDGPLDWTRGQQAAFLILVWQRLRASVVDGNAHWMRVLREEDEAAVRLTPELEPAFNGRKTMLNQEQGVRGVLSVTNELFFRMAVRDRSAFEWRSLTPGGGETSIDEVSEELTVLKASPLAVTVDKVSKAIAEFDWRSADAEGLDDNLRLLKRAFRGSGGYVALREQLLEQVARGGDNAELAAEALAQLRA